MTLFDRVATFFASASLSGAFSGLLAAAIGEISAKSGRPGWAWIFILVGRHALLGQFAHSHDRKGSLLFSSESSPFSCFLLLLKRHVSCQKKNGRMLCLNSKKMAQCHKMIEKTPSAGQRPSNQQNRCMSGFLPLCCFSMVSLNIPV